MQSKKSKRDTKNVVRKIIQIAVESCGYNSANIAASFGPNLLRGEKKSLIQQHLHCDGENMFNHITEHSIYY